jgi:hypothetical protein
MTAPAASPDAHGVPELEAARKPYGAEWPPFLSGTSTDFPDDSFSWPGGQS